jgi:hypothetical protein
VRESVLRRAPTVGSSIKLNPLYSNPQETRIDCAWLAFEILRFAQDDNASLGECLIEVVVAVVLADLDLYVEEIGELGSG